MPDDAPPPTMEPSYYNRRITAEIEWWDWPLSVGMSHPGTPLRYRFQGGLMYLRDLQLEGHVRAPSVHAGKPIRIWLSTFARKERFNADTGEVGRLYIDRPGNDGWPFEAMLRFPEDALPSVLNGLSSVWKYIDIWTRTDTQESAVRRFTFSARMYGDRSESKD